MQRWSVCLRKRARGSLISSPFYLCLTAPASQPPVLLHAGVPQEAALHEGQRSGKERKQLVLSFTTKLTHAQQCDFYPSHSYCCVIKYLELRMKKHFFILWGHNRVLEWKLRVEAYCSCDMHIWSHCTLWIHYFYVVCTDIVLDVSVFINLVLLHLFI